MASTDAEGGAEQTDAVEAAALSVFSATLHKWLLLYNSRAVTGGQVLDVYYPGFEVSMYGHRIQDGDSVTVVASGEVVRVDYFFGSPTALRGTAAEGQHWFQLHSDEADEPVYPGTACVTNHEVRAACRLQSAWRVHRKWTTAHFAATMRCVAKCFKDLGKPRCET